MNENRKQVGDDSRRGSNRALLVGTLLITINHGDALVRGDIDRARVLKMALTLLVPYCVSTISSVGAMRAMRDGASHG